MIKQIKNLLRQYTPHVIVMIWHSLYFHYTRFHVNKKSEITKILEENWKDYKIDLYPKDRRLSILEKKKVYGGSTENIRFLINEIVRRFAKNGVYLEVGIWHGCSLLSASLFNSSTRCIGIDNFSELNPEDKNESILRENFKKFGDPENIEFYKKDGSSD